MTRNVNTINLSTNVHTGQDFSVKEIRKLLPKEYKLLSDDQVAYIVRMVDVVVSEFIDAPVPN